MLRVQANIARRVHAREITRLRHVHAVEYYSCTALAGACMRCSAVLRCARVLESGCQLCCTCTLAMIAVDHFFCCGRVTAFACIALHYAVDQWPVRDRQRPFTARKTRKTSLLYIKTQRQGHTTRSRSSNETSSPTRGNMEPGWTTVIQFYFGSVQFSVKQKFAVSVRRKFRMRERDPQKFEQVAASVIPELKF